MPNRRTTGMNRVIGKTVSRIEIPALQSRNFRLLPASGWYMSNFLFEEQEGTVTRRTEFLVSNP